MSDRFAAGVKEKVHKHREQASTSPVPGDEGKKRKKYSIMKQKRKPPPQDTQQRLTKAVTHIRLIEVNPGKLAVLDALASVYLALCQQHVTLFCTEQQPDKFHPPVFVTPLSERWHRVAI